MHIIAGNHRIYIDMQREIGDGGQGFAANSPIFLYYRLYSDYHMILI
ncbi:hypothetical protein B4168_0050 [Anoxybacillus flavithermus]|nr:hypothetical protein B4168_0050 [Anoxybacillus flavithermus]